jgi:hypothetical protein
LFLLSLMLTEQGCVVTAIRPMTLCFYFMLGALRYLPL